MTMTQAEANGTWIESGPHLMLFPKDPESLDSWPDDPFKGEPYVMFKGTDYAHVMIPLPGYYAYSPADKAPKGFGGSAVAAEPPPAEVPFTPPSALAARSRLRPRRRRQSRRHQAHGVAPPDDVSASPHTAHPRIQPLCLKARPTVLGRPSDALYRVGAAVQGGRNMSKTPAPAFSYVAVIKIPVPSRVMLV